jgi:Glycosyltransferase like family 2
MSRAKTLLRRIASRIADPYVADLQNRITAVRADVARESSAARAELARVTEALRSVSDEESRNRRLLYELRRDPSYELAFKERDPLVSFLIPTFDQYETLREVALPSILGQSYANLEVIVIGDGAPAETADAIAAIGDPRVTYFNRPYRGPYPDDEYERWLVAGSPPFNEGQFRATGRWIAPMSDDDAVRRDHTRMLVDAAQSRGHEMCYGRMEVHFENGRSWEVGEFPPRFAGLGSQGSIYHSGLSFIHSDLVDATFGEPNDWSRTRRMLQIGVYVGMVDEVVVDKHERKSSPANYGFVEDEARTSEWS